MAKMIYIRKKAELPQTTASRKNKALSAQPIIYAEERKVEELIVKSKSPRATNLVYIINCLTSSLGRKYHKEKM